LVLQTDIGLDELSLEKSPASNKKDDELIASEDTANAMFVVFAGSIVKSKKHVLADFNKDEHDEADTINGEGMTMLDKSKAEEPVLLIYKRVLPEEEVKSEIEPT